MLPSMKETWLKNESIIQKVIKQLHYYAYTLHKYDDWQWNELENNYPKFGKL